MVNMFILIIIGGSC